MCIFCYQFCSQFCKEFLCSSARKKSFYTRQQIMPLLWNHRVNIPSDGNSEMLSCTDIKLDRMENSALINTGRAGEDFRNVIVDGENKNQAGIIVLSR
ncbi:hypothetical protein NPIL_450851 [Nephila pilipes]|uniref:Uncharacterized protein n=1 Tax=Nephila pilipes TaxID=299642 RepID=A0A8X6NEQ1_NEPPI|nr:hypothetical protein NPIL_450851 [Nephila pilipes]